jgi:hypothetical protein
MKRLFIFIYYLPPPPQLYGIIFKLLPHFLSSIENCRNKVFCTCCGPDCRLLQRLMLKECSSQVHYFVVYFVADWFEVRIDVMCTHYNVQVILIGILKCPVT